MDALEDNRILPTDVGLHGCQLKVWVYYMIYVKFNIIDNVFVCSGLPLLTLNL